MANEAIDRIFAGDPKFQSRLRFGAICKANIKVTDVVVIEKFQSRLRFGAICKP